MRRRANHSRFGPAVSVRSRRSAAKHVSLSPEARPLLLTPAAAVSHDVRRPRHDAGEFAPVSRCRSRQLLVPVPV